MLRTVVEADQPSVRRRRLDVFHIHTPQGVRLFAVSLGGLTESGDRVT